VDAFVLSGLHTNNRSRAGESGFPKGLGQNKIKNFTPRGNLTAFTGREFNKAFFQTDSEHDFRSV
jgi:hypothetical protein